MAIFWISAENSVSYVKFSNYTVVNVLKKNSLDIFSLRSNIITFRYIFETPIIDVNDLLYPPDHKCFTGIYI